MRFLAATIATSLAAYAFGFWLSVPANPETQFWQHVIGLRNAEISQVRKEDPNSPIIFFTGGSTCAFSIDPNIIEQTCGLPSFNLGLPVSAGAKFLLHQALEKCRKNDVLIVCLEPDLLAFESDFEPTTLSFGLAVMAGDQSAAVGGTSFGERLSLRQYFNLMRPGPGYTSTRIAKAAAGRGYRYEIRDIRYHGRIETSVKKPSLPLAGEGSNTTLAPSGRTLLETFQRAASKKGVTVFYAMPWLLTAESSAENNRTNNLQILSSIQSIIPTIDDGYQGVATDPLLFADSAQHLDAAGSAIRTQALAGALRSILNR